MRLEGVRGVVLDLDGTVYDDRGLMPGAAEAVMAIRSARLGLRFATNTSRYPRGALVERLRSLGVHAGLDDVITAPRAAASWLADHGLTRISLHVAAATVEEFAAFAIDERSPQAVVLGDLGDGWSVERLNRVFRHVLGGARLLAIQKNRYWMRSGSLCLDAGPFVTAIEYATGVTAFVAGKPSEQFFVAAARTLGLSAADLIVVGDDVRTDVEGAQAAGARGVLVRTGKFRAADLDDSDLQPDLILDSIADLPATLGV
jgi:HAD superfamily hydrolase (TIGR01458 family)